MNKLMAIGNLVRTPELRITSNGIPVASFTIAVNGRKQEDKPSYIRCTAWRQLGENCAKYLSKGNKVFISGPISVSTYTAQDGSTRASLEVTADEVEFLTPRAAGDHEADSAPGEAFVPVDPKDLPEFI